MWRLIRSHILHYITANLPTNIVDFRGFDSSIMLCFRCGILMSIGNFPESLSQAMLVGCNVSREIGRIAVHPVRIAQIRCPRFVPRVGLPGNLLCDRHNIVVVVVVVVVCIYIYI